ncbi:ATP-binding protein [Roseovarius dicentrarchi]|uniref:ATP-binding protein n=1 Tax=Roseovarius dicentrarchi TaxID=2250573 RepID=UPI000DEA9DAD|nr:ATP-binding protein [Roseovarius dicentrarchi]
MDWAADQGAPAKTARDAVSARRRVFAIQATEKGVRAGLAEMRGFLSARGLDADFCGTAEIVLAEALNNIAEHALVAALGATIRVTLTTRQGGLTAEIVDTGTALPGLSPPVGQLPPLGGSAHSLPEGGFGWYLIRKLTDCLSYTRHAGENHLCLRISFARTAAVATPVE